MKNDVFDTVQSLVNLQSLFTSPVFVSKGISKKNNQIKTKLRKFLPHDQSKQSITYASLDSHYMTLWTTNCPGVLPFPPPFTRRVLRPVPTLPRECWEKKASTSVPSTRTTEGIWWTGKHSFIHRKDGWIKERKKEKETGPDKKKKWGLLSLTTQSNCKETEWWAENERVFLRRRRLVNERWI